MYLSVCSRMMCPWMIPPLDETFLERDVHWTSLPLDDSSSEWNGQWMIFIDLSPGKAIPDQCVQRPNSWTKSRQKSFLLGIHSHLYRSALKFIFLQTHATSFILEVIACKMRKVERRIIQGTLHSRDASSKNKCSGTHRSKKDWQHIQYV